ncbi:MULTISPECIES: DUF1934 domain-containing protein [Bacillus]|uniref:Beta-barrel protein ywib n=2 Tax=Bacillus TaxID=1386 RepID=A0A0M4FLA7_9BACI|nr:MULTISPECIES: DUF1934 family protein [Bacillus]ALC82767.1 beta-barrel protein ywib [Bacillus gobiensis]MBP1081722.1 uncharacterized beta-barrel protein YwiB (DUF1934 family) [Bacillus capparidis]MED1096375.1 DUF1934 family protein [Bacillus capparidis]
MNRETPVSIHVQSVVNEGKDTETIEFQTTGQYYLKNNKIYLVYHEEHDLGKVKTTVKAHSGEVLIMRTGAIRMKQRFLPDVHTRTLYKMPFGELELGVETKEIEIGSGTIRLVYDMLVDHDQRHLHTLTIAYKEEQG